MDYVLLFYYSKDNIFVNELGQVVFNIFDYLSPGELYLFKKKQDYWYEKRSPSSYIEIHYLDETEH